MAEWNDDDRPAIDLDRWWPWIVAAALVAIVAGVALLIAAANGNGWTEYGHGAYVVVQAGLLAWLWPTTRRLRRDIAAHLEPPSRPVSPALADPRHRPGRVTTH